MNKLFLLVCVALVAFFCSCKKAAKAETVTVRDTVYVPVPVNDTTVIPAMISDTTTTLIILRHAEKELTGSDPNLDANGVARAEELKRILGAINIHAIYSTPYNRTRQTVTPLATAKGLTITEYPTSKPYAELINEIAAAGRGKVSVIAGHSNTVPDILKTISNNSFNITIADHQYDNLFIVTMPDSLAPTIMHLKYGKATP